jgi:hypothetical protein
MTKEKKYKRINNYLQNIHIQLKIELFYKQSTKVIKLFTHTYMAVCIVLSRWLILIRNNYERHIYRYPPSLSSYSIIEAVDH